MARALVVFVFALTALAIPTPTRAQETVDVNSLGLSASYVVDATFDWHGKGAEVRTTATVTGSKPWTSGMLAFNLPILRIGDAQLTAALVDGRSIDASTDDQTILVPLDPPLAPGGSVVVQLDYTASLSGTPDPNGDDWGFAATSNYLTAYRWVPWLSRTTPFDRPSVGEPYVTATASDVQVTITADPTLVFAATGVQTSANGEVRTFEAHDVRDFNFAASPTYRTAERTVRGTRLVMYYNRLDPDGILDVTERAFNDFSEKVGAYPYPELSIAETGPWAGIESPGTFWLPDNSVPRLLPWMTAHEAAHQWFYSVVGNDQAREPFADEALSDFMARNLIGRFVPSPCPTGFLDQTVYDLGECYPWVIYVQGNQWLRDYRDAVGSATFWRGVADYYARYKFGMGGTRPLLDALDRTAGTVQIHERFPRLYAVPVVDLPFGFVR